VRSRPQFITTLIEPRSSIQAVSGILPSKSIDIPPNFYVNILNNISVTFLAAPILSCTKISIPLAEAMDSTWSWLEQQNSDQWLEISEIGQITRDTTSINYFKHIDPSESEDKLWNYLAEDKIGWLKPAEDGRKYWITPRNQRAAKQLEKPYDELQKTIEVLLDRLADKVRPATTEATFLPQEIREGWLKLKRVTQH